MRAVASWSLLVATLLATINAAPISVRKLYRERLRSLKESGITVTADPPPVIDHHDRDFHLPAPSLSIKSLHPYVQATYIELPGSVSTIIDSVSSPFAIPAEVPNIVQATQKMNRSSALKAKKRNTTSKAKMKQYRLTHEAKRQYLGLSRKDSVPPNARYNKLNAIKEGLLSKGKDRFGGKDEDIKFFQMRNSAKAKLFGFSRSIPLPEKAKWISVEELEEQIKAAGGVREYIGEGYDAWIKEVKATLNTSAKKSKMKRRLYNKVFGSGNDSEKPIQMRDVTIEELIEWSKDMKLHYRRGTTAPNLAAEQPNTETTSIVTAGVS